MLFPEALADRIATSQDAVTLAFIYRTDPLHGSFVQPWKVKARDSPQLTLDHILGLVPPPNVRPKFHDQISRPTASQEHVNQDSTGLGQSQNIPLEIFEQILTSISCHDAQQMRLVCRDWERKVSGYLFRSVVIPFSTDIYSTAEPHSIQHHRQSKAAGKCPRSHELIEDTFEEDEHTLLDHRQQGIDMFSSFGPHMRQFGIRFEVDESILADPPLKFLQNGYDSYWGPYAWPLKDYPRFADRASLEMTADETATMIQAFGKLEQVTEMALAIDSGLGHLHGQDRSIRARFLPDISPIFPAARFTPNPRLDSKRQLWRFIHKTFELADVLSDLRFATMIRLTDPSFKNDILQMTKENEAMPWYHTEPDILTQSRNDPSYLDDFDCSVELTSAHTACDEWGILIIRSIHTEEEAKQGYQHTVIPKNLSRLQTEWLLETAWAQDAFLSSYVLSVSDNREAFANVSRLTLSRTSSRHFTALMRKEFWNALPVLQICEINVIADYREVTKDKAGMAQSRFVRRAFAHDRFHDLIEQRLACKQSIKTLVIGWVEGGEHAQGIVARGKLVLPAPLSTGDWFLNINDSTTGDLIILPFVERLVLRNCWVAPNVLRAIVLTNAACQLTSMVLDSVSLTSHPRAPAAVADVDDDDDDEDETLFDIMENAQPHYHEAPEMHEERDGRYPETLQSQDRNRGRSIGSLTIRRPLLSATPHTLVVPSLNHSRARVTIPPRPGSWREVLDSLDVTLRNMDVERGYGTDAALDASSSSTAHAPSPHGLNIKFLSAGYAFLPRIVRGFRQNLFARLHYRNDRRRTRSDWSEQDNRMFQARHDMVMANTIAAFEEPIEAVLLCSWPQDEMLDLLYRWAPNLYRGWPYSELAENAIPGKSPNAFAMSASALQGSTASTPSLAEEEEATWGRWGSSAREAPKFDGMKPGGSGRFSGEINIGFGMHKSSHNFD